MAASNRTMIGLFADAVQATAAVRALREAGFPEEAIGIVTPDTEGHPKTGTVAGVHVVTDNDTPIGATESGEGAVAGTILGVSLGALLAATGAIVIPGIGPFIAGGILATAITGGVVGALAGALVGLGVPKEDAEYYEAQIHAGNTLVSVAAGDRAEEAAAILTEYGAEPARSPVVPVA